MLFLIIYQSNPAANEGSMAGAINLAHDVRYFSALAFLYNRNELEKS